MRNHPNLKTRFFTRDLLDDLKSAATYLDASAQQMKNSFTVGGHFTELREKVEYGELKRLARRVRKLASHLGRQKKQKQ